MATRGETNYSCCSACLDDGRNTVARHYCVDCEMYFCTKCVKCHNKIPSLKAHQVNEVTSSDSTEADDDLCTSERVSDSVQISTCSLHQGKPIDTHCKDHDEVCCGACAVVKHRTCTTVSIVVAAKDYKSSHERNKCKYALNETIAKYNVEKEKRVENLECIGKQKQELIENVDKYEEKIIAKIKELANISRKEIRSKYEEHKTAIEKDIETIDVVLTTTNRHVDKLEQTDDEQLFITIKTSNTVTKEWEILQQAMTTDWRKRVLIFYFDTTFDNHILTMTSFGLLEDYSDDSEYTSTFKRNINIRQGNDPRETNIYDMCLMESGELLLTDDNNKKLKRFSSNLQFKDELLLSGDPVAICILDTCEVAVRIWNTKVVHIVSVGQKMQIISSFTIANNGWGIAYDAGYGEILACETNKVSVYSKTGNKLRTYGKDTNGEQMFSKCRQIALSVIKQDIYVTDKDKGLIVLDRNGTLKMKVSLTNIIDIRSLCLLPGDICLAGCEASGVIVQINKEGNQVVKLIDTKNGRNHTYSAMYDRKHSRLIVGGDNNLISVYTLSAK